MKLTTAAAIEHTELDAEAMLKVTGLPEPPPVAFTV
jgi:hypothetical protein